MRELLRPGDIIQWQGKEWEIHRVKDAKKVPMHLKVQATTQKRSLLIPRWEVPFILVRRIEDWAEPGVSQLREREVMLLAQIQQQLALPNTYEIVLIELKRCLNMIRLDLLRKDARLSFQPEDGLMDVV